MKNNEVKIGGTYVVKVSGLLQSVKITGESPYGGWDGVNERTGRKVRIRSARKLRREIPARGTAEYSALKPAVNFGDCPVTCGR